MNLQILIVCCDKYYSKAIEIRQKFETFGYNVDGITNDMTDEEINTSCNRINAAIIIFPCSNIENIINTIIRNGTLCISVSDSLNDIPKWYMDVNHQSINTVSIDDCFESLYAIKSSITNVNNEILSN